MNDIGSIASVVGAVVSVLVLYFTRRDKRFEDIKTDTKEKIDGLKTEMNIKFGEVREEMRAIESRINYRFDDLIQEFRSFRLEVRNRFDRVEADSIAFDRRLIVLETINQESKRPLASPPRPEERPIIRRRRRPKS